MTRIDGAVLDPREEAIFERGYAAGRAAALAEMERAELRGVAKILDLLWENSYYSMGRDASERIEKELRYYFGDNWMVDMYSFLGVQGGERPEPVKPLDAEKGKNESISGL